MIKVQDITKKYGPKTVVDAVSFQVERGEILGLLGPNGAGKSTILSIMATVLAPTGGDILIDGASVISQRKKVRRLISYVPQQLALQSTLSVLDNMKFWSGMAVTKVTKEDIEKIADVINLKDRMNDKVYKLSEGMKRRLNIGIALLHDPAVLIMDEPTLGVDIRSKKEIVDFIHTLAKWNKTIVYTSHDLHEIEQLCHRVALLNEGKLMFTGTIQEAKQTSPTPASTEKTLATLAHWW